MTSSVLDILNPQQRAAVTAGDGPVLVLAGPGSGKTRVLTHRIAYLMGERGVRASHILAVTFTNKAAAEMRSRVEALLGGRLDGLQIGTFHAICARLLRIESHHTVYGHDYAIYDTDDQIAVIKAVLSELNLDTKKFSPGRVLNAISAAKNELIEPEAYIAADYFGEIVRRVYPLYQQRLISSNALDFDDLLMQTALLLRDNDEVRGKYQARYQHVLIDEFQDTNQAQYQLVGLLGQPQNNVFVVGDEDQGIYAFRGADYRNVMQFRRDYPEAQVILLEQNYRSTQHVLDVARAIIDKNTNRTPKALFTERTGGPLVAIHEAYSEADEGEYVVKTIDSLVKRSGYAYKDFAVMYRTNAQSRALEDACVSAGIPYKLVGGVSFYRRREIKDLIAYLRVINNASDEVSLKRVINVPGRGIGEKSVAAFTAWAAAQDLSYGRALEAIARGATPPVSGRAGAGLIDFATLISDLRALAEGGSLTVLFDELIARTGYTLYINQISDTDEQVTERLDNINELRGLIDSRRDLALSDFLADVALVAEVDALDDRQDAVTLLTLHAAKGLEYPVVFITGLEDGILPHSRSFDSADAMAEERRLLYVGLTRAKDALHLSYAFRRALYGESLLGIPSRFLADIPSELLQNVSPSIRGLHERAGYQKAIAWERAPASGASAGRGKIIPFDSAFQRPQAELKYRSGQRVFHSKFGEGVVLDSRRSGDDEEVTVRFEKVGVKLLSAAFANLAILGGHSP
ncbi:MAG: UvrD-helicase domain-containing protein [Aggregatilineales bacterium]